MIDKAIFKQYTKELDSYEFEIVNYDRQNQVVYDDTTFKPIQLFRLPKYNQFETEYEKLIDTLAKDAYEEICFWDIESKKNALKFLKEKKLKFKDYWVFEHKYHNLINEHSKDFDYVRFILSFFSLFDIRVKNEGFTTNDGFFGNYGLITIEAIEDLDDALMNKQASLDWLIERLGNHLGLLPSKQLPATEQKGFDLGLTEEKLKALHQQLINDDFILCKEIDFINAFNGQQIVNKLEWIDRGKRLTKYVTIQTLFQLLSSCNIELSDKNQVVLKEVKNALNHIFSNKWGNINSKFNDFKPLTTDRKKAIDLMVKNLKS